MGLGPTSQRGHWAGRPTGGDAGGPRLAWALAHVATLEATDRLGRPSYPSRADGDGAAALAGVKRHRKARRPEGADRGHEAAEGPNPAAERPAARFCGWLGRGSVHGSWRQPW